MVLRRLAGFAGLTVALIALIAPIAVSSSAHAAPTDGLVAWYPLDETGGTVAADASGNGRNGTVEGATTWFEGQGFRFSGGGRAAAMPSSSPTTSSRASLRSPSSLDVWTDPALTGNHFVYNLGNLAVGSPHRGPGTSSHDHALPRDDLNPVVEQRAEHEQGVQPPEGGVASPHLHADRQHGHPLSRTGCEVARNTSVTNTPAQIGAASRPATTSVAPRTPPTTPSAVSSVTSASTTARSPPPRCSPRRPACTPGTGRVGCHVGRDRTR